MNNAADTVRSLGEHNNRPPEFTAAALRSLHAVKAHARVKAIRDTAALVAAQMNDRAGILAVLHMLRNGAPQEVAVVLDGTDMSELGIPCPVERSLCTKPVAGAPDPGAAWIATRKAAVIAYYQAELKS